LPFTKRKAKLKLLLARARSGIALNEHIEADGATVFEHARRMGLERYRVKAARRALLVGPIV
jgi:hypothetical protein